MDNYFTSPDLFKDLYYRKIVCCGTVQHNRKGMLPNFGPKALQMKTEDVSRICSNLTAVHWKDKRQVYVLSTIRPPTAEGNFQDRSTMKPQVVQNYNTNMGYVNKSDRMARCYGISHRTWQWTKKLLHFVDLSVLNTFIIQNTCGE